MRIPRVNELYRALRARGRLGGRHKLLCRRGVRRRPAHQPLPVVAIVLLVTVGAVGVKCGGEVGVGDVLSVSAGARAGRGRAGVEGWGWRGGGDGGGKAVVCCGYLCECVSRVFLRRNGWRVVVKGDDGVS